MIVDVLASELCGATSQRFAGVVDQELPNLEVREAGRFQAPERTW